MSAMHTLQEMHACSTGNIPVIAVADALSCTESDTKDIQNDHYRKAVLRGQAGDIGRA
jgi:hypothetical protein